MRSIGLGIGSGWRDDLRSIVDHRDLLVLADEFAVPMTSGRSETIVTAAVLRSGIQP